MTKEKIKKIVLQNKDTLKKYDVKSIALFGSCVRRQQNKNSDIDFLVVFNNPTFRNYIGLQLDFKKLFRVDIDIVCKDALKKRIRPYILKEAEWIKTN